MTHGAQEDLVTRNYRRTSIKAKSLENNAEDYDQGSSENLSSSDARTPVNLRRQSAVQEDLGSQNESLQRDGLPLDFTERSTGFGHAIESDEFQNWGSNFPTDDILPLDDTDIDWFIQNQFLFDVQDDSVINPSESTLAVKDSSSGHPSTIFSTTPESEGTEVGLGPPPIYLQESHSKLFVSNTGNHEAPSCGFRICNALTDQRRFELLLALRAMMDIDVTEKIFSLNSMKQGIHLYCRNMSIEYSIIHTELMVPSSEESLAAAVKECGGVARPEIMWAIITFGWSMMRSESGYEYEVAKRIQKGLRTTIISVSISFLVCYIRNPR